jgi:hypothetical protein
MSAGAFDSEGDLQWWGQQEAEDIYDTVEWIARQSWSSGSVGMTCVPDLGSLTRPNMAQRQFVAFDLSGQLGIALCAALVESARTMGELHVRCASCDARRPDASPQRHVPRERASPPSPPSAQHSAPLQFSRGGIPTVPFQAFIQGGFAGHGSAIDMAKAIETHPFYDDFWKGLHIDVTKFPVDLPVYLLASCTPSLPLAQFFGLPRTEDSSMLHTFGSFRTFREAPSKNKWIRVHNQQEWCVGPAPAALRRRSSPPGPITTSRKWQTSFSGVSR